MKIAVACALALAWSATALALAQGTTKAATEKVLIANKQKISEAVAKGNLASFNSLVSGDGISADMSGFMKVSDFTKSINQVNGCAFGGRLSACAFGPRPRARSGAVACSLEQLVDALVRNPKQFTSVSTAEVQTSGGQDLHSTAGNHRRVFGRALGLLPRGRVRLEQLPLVGRHLHRINELCAFICVSITQCACCAAGATEQGSRSRSKAVR